MGQGSTLSAFLVWGLYPAWLIAGAGDYLCHRRTHIEQHAGVLESLYHVGQFAVLGALLVMVVTLPASWPALGAMAAAVILHSVLAHLDVRYSHQRRYISPLEQRIHGFLEVLPLVAVGLIAVLWWPQLVTNEVAARALISGTNAAWLLASYFVLAGAPVVEELTRTWRAARPQNAR